MTNENRIDRLNKEYDKQHQLSLESMDISEEEKMRRRNNKKEWDKRNIDIFVTKREVHELYNLTDGADVSKYTLRVLSEEKLKDFVTRNFEGDVTKVEEWVRQNSKEKTIVSNSGTFTVKLYDLEYELEDNESIKDIDWDDEGSIELVSGMSGKFSGQEHSGELNTWINLDINLLNLKILDPLRVKYEGTSS